MTSKIIHKKSSVVNRVPVAGDLQYGELAINYADGYLYYKTSGNAIGRFKDSDKLDSDIIQAINNVVDSDFIIQHTPTYVTKTGTQTLTNKTLTAPKFGDSSQGFAQAYGGFSFNKDTQLGDSTQSIVSILSQDSSLNAGITFGVDNQTKNAIGTVLDRDNNVGTMYFSVGNASTSIKFTRRAVEGSTVAWDGVAGNNNDDLLTIDASGVVKIPDNTAATNKTSGALVVTGGLGVSGDIKASDIETSGNVQAQGAFIGNVTGQVSTLSNHNTGGLSEGTNKYYTPTRVDSDFDARLASKNTANLTEGSNKYYTPARADSDAKHAVSVTDAGGDGSLSYNSSNGTITYQGPVAADTRAHFSGGTGVTISNGSIAIGQDVSTSSVVTFGGGSTISGDLNVSGDLTIGGNQIQNQVTDLRVTNAMIKLADSNAGNSVDIGLVGRYSTDGRSTIRRAGFIRDASNGEFYAFQGLVQDGLDSSVADQTINVNGTGWELGTWNFGALRGQYLGWDSDYSAFQSDYIVKTSTYTASAGDRIAANTDGGAFTINLPANPSTGNTVHFIDIGNWSSGGKYLDIGRNGQTIEGVADNFRLDVGQNTIDFIFINNTWNVYAAVGQRGEQGIQGAAGESVDSDTLNQNAIAYAIALG